MTDADTTSPIDNAESAETASGQSAGQDAPVLNRAERRARAKGKTASAGSAIPTSSRGVPAHGPAGRGSTTGAPTLFPRTGHK